MKNLAQVFLVSSKQQQTSQRPAIKEALKLSFSNHCHPSTLPCNTSGIVLTKGTFVPSTKQIDNQDFSSDFHDFDENSVISLSSVELGSQSSDCDDVLLEDSLAETFNLMFQESEKETTPLLVDCEVSTFPISIPSKFSSLINVCGLQLKEIKPLLPRDQVSK